PCSAIARVYSATFSGVPHFGSYPTSFISPSPSARAQPSGGESGAGRATGGDGGAVSWHGSVRAISWLFALRLRPVNANLAKFFRTFDQAALPAGLFIAIRSADRHAIDRL